MGYSWYTTWKHCITTCSTCTICNWILDHYLFQLRLDFLNQYIFVRFLKIIHTILACHFLTLPYPTRIPHVSTHQTRNPRCFILIGTLLHWKPDLWSCSPHSPPLGQVSNHCKSPFPFVNNQPTCTFTGI